MRDKSNYRAANICKSRPWRGLHDPPGRGPGRKVEYTVVGPAPRHRPEGVHQLRMGRDHAGAVPLALPHCDRRRGGGKVQVPPL